MLYISDKIIHLHFRYLFVAMKRFFVLIFVLGIGFASMAQKIEAGLMGGAMFYVGDLTEKATSSPKHLAGGMFLRINMNPWISLKGNVLIGGISAADSTSTKQFSLNRNLSFKSKISEFAAEVEVNLTENYKSNGERKRCVPYVFAGINVFHFNPQANLYDSLSGKTITYELQPLGTEGQGLTKYPNLKPYNLNGFALPLGVGVKLHFADKLTMGVEFGMRKTFTDYLDDVSGYYAENDLISAQYGPTAAKLADRTNEVLPGVENPKATARGNLSTQDWYGFGGILISYTFIKQSKYKCNQF